MAAFVLDNRGVKKLLDRITQIEQRLQASGTLKRQLGKLVTEQTKRRITSEKTTPSGAAWKKWSIDYARTRGPGHSLLISTGALRDSIKTRATKDGIAVTSDRDYSAAVNEVRTFLGISAANQEEIHALISEWMERSL